MRINLLKIVAIGALLTPLLSMASAECPPANIIKAKTLKQAARLDNQRWYLTSDTFNHQYRDWNVMFITEISAKNATEALQQGIVNFQRTAITNRDPAPQNMDGMSYCYYTSPTGKNRITAMSFAQDGYATKTTP